MKKFKYIAATIVLMLIVVLTTGCSERGYEYDIPTSISFEGVDNNNVVQIASGVTTYIVKGKVTCAEGIEQFGIYNANARTGAPESNPISGTQKTFTDFPQQYDFEYTASGIESNKAFKVIITSPGGEKVQAGMVIQITPVVEFTRERIIESYDYWYGMYYASWYEGRVYKQREAAEWAGQIDISMCEIDGKPYFISPASRATQGLENYQGARATKFEETALTAAQFNAIKQIDASPLAGLNPTSDRAEIKANKVYSFKTADNKTGLILVGTAGSEKHRDIATVTVFNAKITVKKAL